MLEWLELTPVAYWVRQSWGWPFAQTIHVFGSAIIGGFGLIICLWTLGILKTLPTRTLRGLIGFIWLSLALQVVSGILLLLPTGPGPYVSDWWFDAKLVLIAVAIDLTVRFNRMLQVQRDGSVGKQVANPPARFVTLAPSIWVAVCLLAAATPYTITYNGRWAYSFGSFWTLPLIFVVLAIVFVSIYSLDKKT